MATLSDARRLVVKIGSALLVDRTTGSLRRDWLLSLATDVARIRARGTDVILVSSGSIALGRGVLGLGQGELPLEQSQAAAAVGQIQLARAYQDALEPHGIVTAQVLVTLDDSTDRRRYLNSRATMETLLGLGVVPIVNENDTIATDEIRYGDNDRLAAQVAVTVGADQLILLSDVDGLYTANPQSDPKAQHISVVPVITPAIMGMAGDAVSGISKGGMKTKVLAARVATEAGCALCITLGSPFNPLTALEGRARSTWFTAQTTPQAARKGWIAAMKPRGTLAVDAGADAALHDGRSLLPAGVMRVTGVFERGDPVAIVNLDSAMVAIGLTNYNSQEAIQIMGRRSGDAAAILGYKGRAALVHRDDMVLQDRST